MQHWAWETGQGGAWGPGCYLRGWGGQLRVWEQVLHPLLRLPFLPQRPDPSDVGGAQGTSLDCQVRSSLRLGQGVRCREGIQRTLELNSFCWASCQIRTA